MTPTVEEVERVYEQLLGLGLGQDEARRIATSARTYARMTPLRRQLRQVIREVGLVPSGDRPPGDWLGDLVWPFPLFAPRSRPFDWALDEALPY